MAAVFVFFISCFSSFFERRRSVVDGRTKLLRKMCEDSISVAKDLIKKWTREDHEISKQN